MVDMSRLSRRISGEKSCSARQKHHRCIEADMSSGKGASGKYWIRCLCYGGADGRRRAPPISCRIRSRYYCTGHLWAYSLSEGTKASNAEENLSSSNPELEIVIVIYDGYGSARQECGMGLEGGSLREDKVSTPRASGYSQEWLPDTLHIESNEGIFKLVEGYA